MQETPPLLKDEYKFPFRIAKVDSEIDEETFIAYAGLDMSLYPEMTGKMLKRELV